MSLASAFLMGLLLMATGLSLLLLWQAIISRKRDQLPLALPIFQAGIALWLLAYTWEFSVLDLGSKILASKVQYVGIVTVPLSWLLYTFHHTQRDRPIRPQWVGLLCIEPILVVAAAWTNESHRLLWQQMTLLPLSPTLATLRITYGPLFYVHTLYTYGIIVWATALLLKNLWRSRQLYRKQSLTLLISAGAPWLGNIFYLLNQSLFSHSDFDPASGTVPPTEWATVIDWTPFGFLISGLAVLWGRWQFRLWDIVPIARDTLIEGMREGILVLDHQHRVIDLNPALQHILQLPTPKILGKPVAQILSPWPLLLSQVQEPSDHQRLLTHEQSCEGSTSWYEISLSPLYNTHQKRLGQLLIWRDVTPQKRIERELERIKDAAEAASQAKSRFLATMSHELRTPLNAILGYSELLQQESQISGNPEILADLRTIHQSGRNLLSLINNILDFSKVEAGKFSVVLEPCDAVSLVLEASRTVEPLMQKNRNQSQVRYSEAIPPLYSDPMKIRQVLLNLLANAAKFTTEGTVILSVEPLDVSSGSAASNKPDPSISDPDMPDSGMPDSSIKTPTWIRFQVQDTGIGMTPDQLQRIFQPFVQAEDSTARRYGGTGLGLALSQSFCHLLGGAISVKSELGAGSTFTVDLPISSPTALEPSSQQAQNSPWQDNP
ncbi:MAG: ATP-binding protein [Thermosynechococcaceae cyanobacterium MS004]|nr:ATP-binding protein [Thermosynechococcaceae cyanobacterium MS004]